MKKTGWVVPVIYPDGRVIKTIFKTEADAIKACEQFEQDWQVHAAKQTADFLAKMPPEPPPKPSLWQRVVNFMDQFSQVGPGGHL